MALAKRSCWIVQPCVAYPLHVPSSVAKLPVGPEEKAGLAMRRGSPTQALTELMEGYGDAIYRHCHQVMGDADSAADVQQTVFVQAYRDLERFDGRSSYRTWLYSIARHRCLDALKMRRRRRKRFILSGARPSMQVADPQNRADQDLDAEAARKHIDQALQMLKPEVRIAVLLRYREEMSFEEMALVCGERSATLQARVSRALPKLRKMLEKLR